MAEKRKNFVIRKGRTAYSVSVFKKEVEVEPFDKPTHYNTSSAIATTLQTIANTKMVIDQPVDPFQYLLDYFIEKGWIIEDLESPDCFLT